MADILTCQGIEESTRFDPYIPLRINYNFNFLDQTTTSSTHSITSFDIFPSSQLRRYDMCTENLGNETGCEMTETTVLPYTNDESATMEIVETKKSVSRNFPPPLTTMSSSKSILVSTYREGGRLVIKATRSTSSMFRMERSHGRLRMYVLGYCDEKEAVVDEGEMSREGVEEVTMVKVGGSGGRCKQGEPQDSRLFNWEPFNWVATT